MAGVRLRHESLTNVNFVVVHHRRYQVPMLCAVCGDVHAYKTYHLRLDSQGEVVVSTEIAERLAELEGLPLRKVGAEAHPRPQTLVLGTKPVREARLQTFVPSKLQEAVQAARR